MPGPPNTLRSEGRAWRQDRLDLDRSDTHEAPASAPAHNAPLDLERVIAWVSRRQGNDTSIGYAIRRVANEATAEQTAAFLAVLLNILRREPGSR
jgi:hypothetical protein